MHIDRSQAIRNKCNGNNLNLGNVTKCNKMKCHLEGIDAKRSYKLCHWFTSTNGKWAIAAHAALVRSHFCYHLIGIPWSSRAVGQRLGHRKPRS